MKLHSFLLIIGLSLCTTLIISCKKQELQTPVNSGLAIPADCSTCPSAYHDFIESIPDVTSCDDFESYTWVPTGDTLGYTQNDVYPIVQVPYFGVGGIDFWELGGTNPGMYGIEAGANFLCDGSEQIVEFEVYGFYVQYDQMGFNVNGSSLITLDNMFPMTLNGVTVDLDTSLLDTTPFEHATLSFTGNIDHIVLHAFESGIVNMCITPINQPVSQTESSELFFTDF
jgi:hypothetical protein